MTAETHMISNTEVAVMEAKAVGKPALLPD
jgi:hypothetical protein